MKKVGDRVRIVMSRLRTYEQLFVGQEGTIVSYVGHSPGLVVRFDDGKREPFYDDELKSVLPETPLLEDELATSLRAIVGALKSNWYIIGILPGSSLSEQWKASDKLVSQAHRALARYMEEVGDA